MSSLIWSTLTPWECELHSCFCICSSLWSVLYNASFCHCLLLCLRSIQLYSKLYLFSTIRCVLPLFKHDTWNIIFLLFLFPYYTMYFLLILIAFYFFITNSLGVHIIYWLIFKDSLHSKVPLFFKKWNLKHSTLLFPLIFWSLAFRFLPPPWSV